MYIADTVHCCIQAVVPRRVNRVNEDARGPLGHASAILGT